MPIPCVPNSLARWMAPFAGLFTRPTWVHVLVLVAGAILTPGRRTVTTALSVLGLRDHPGFTNFHRVLNRNRWSSRAAARHLLALLVAAFVPQGPVVVGLDETIERRWGPNITARGIHREGGSQVSPSLLPYRRFASVAFGAGSKPVRSSRGHFVKASGLRWSVVMLLAPIPWAGRVWALPFLSALAPSERSARQAGRRHKTLIDWARQLLSQVARWLPGRAVVAVADSSYAAIELLNALRRRLTIVTRLRLDARLFEPAPPRRPGTKGRPRVAGARLPSLERRLADPRTVWRRVRVHGWLRWTPNLRQVALRESRSYKWHILWSRA